MFFHNSYFSMLIVKNFLLSFLLDLFIFQNCLQLFEFLISIDLVFNITLSLHDGKFFAFLSAGHLNVLLVLGLSDFSYFQFLLKRQFMTFGTHITLIFCNHFIEFCLFLLFSNMLFNNGLVSFLNLPCTSFTNFFRSFDSPIEI